MGMDVYGKKPQTKVGEYFRNNVWWWHPLWDYCESVAPDITNKVLDAHNNSGDGLDAFDARQLAFKLGEEIVNGRTGQYVVNYYKRLELLPKQECFIKIENHTECNVCKGEGMIPNFANSYHINVENVQEFQQFLMECGGFEIC